jgi:hypothetical protein
VLLDDLRLGAAALHDGRVVPVDQIRLRVEILYELIVGLRVLDAVIHADIGDERVDRHHIPPSVGPAAPVALDPQRAQSWAVGG